MPTPSIETVRAWLGRVMIDRDGQRIGEITDIYLDNETGRPEWAVVRTGLFGLRSTFAPLGEATEVGEHVQVRHERAQVKDAPNIEPDGQLSAAEEAELYRHYGLDYDAVMADTTTGGATVPGSQSDGPSDRSDGQARTPTSQPGAAEEASVADTTESSPPPPPDPFPVGEGASQPFIYETPGRPGDDPGTRRRQTGQMRLRRYLVTEVVTDTASGQRHEVRVEREPISDDEIDAIAGTPGAGEPASVETTGVDDSDWFRAEGDPPR